MEMSASKLWEKILKIIKKRVNEVEFNTFFKNVEAEEISDDTLKLICSTNLVKKNMEKYKEQIEEIIEIITDEEMKAVFEVKVQEPVQSSSYRFSENRADRNERINTGLNEKNNIDNFVVGDNSRLAYNACQAVVENEIPVYNPLLIYGGSGLGKTHLIQATGNAIVEKYPYKNPEVYPNLQSSLQSHRNQIRLSPFLSKMFLA